ncbi:MAG: prolipoprotein diacylglyceryl transferase [Prevotella sp.]|nr:prolipoprotein diacylglyceryl transferase [Prevotella sp.]
MNTFLFINWNPDIEAFHIGSLSFRWYSLCWLIGLALAYIVVRKLYKDQKIPQEKFDPLFIYCFLGILIGARLGHCLFYQPGEYLTSMKGFIEMLLPIHFTDPDSWSWKLTGYEGLASHGGTLGLMLALWLYVNRVKVPLWQVLDNIAIATGITACFIRLGNLMNSEIIGSVTSVPWAFVFEQRDGLPRHPAQLYEAIAYGLLFFIMLWIYKKRNNPKNGNETGNVTTPLHNREGQGVGLLGTGFYFGFCLTYIFTFRFFVEFFKKTQVGFEDSMPLDMGQLLSIPFVAIGIYCMIKARSKK